MNPTDAPDLIEKSIKIGQQVIRLKRIVTPDYQAAAADLRDIWKSIQEATTAISRWLFRFAYFDMYQQNARSEFLKAKAEYSQMKTGPDFNQLKFRCSQIGPLYEKNVRSAVIKWFTNQKKQEEVNRVFYEIANGDVSMLLFVNNEIIGRLDPFVEKLHQLISAGQFDEAERVRLEFVSATRETEASLIRINADLSDLILKFDRVATGRNPSANG